MVCSHLCEQLGGLSGRLLLRTGSIETVSARVVIALSGSCITQGDLLFYPGPRIDDADSTSPSAAVWPTIAMGHTCAGVNSALTADV